MILLYHAQHTLWCLRIAGRCKHSVLQNLYVMSFYKAFSLFLIETLREIDLADPFRWSFQIHFCSFHKKDILLIAKLCLTAKLLQILYLWIRCTCYHYLDISFATLII